MNITELQIGDWVIPHVFDSALEPSKIVGIQYNSYEGKDYVDWVDCEVWDDLGLNDIEPIPLTPEILEKNGFKLNPQGSYSIRNISIDILDGYYNANMNTNNPQSPSFLYQVGKYVHELQHALRLCKIEKEIIL